MKVKTKIRAGESSGGAATVTQEMVDSAVARALETPETRATIEAGVRNAIEGSGLGDIGASIEALPGRWSEVARMSSPQQLATAEWWTDDAVFHNGVPPGARKRVKARIHRAFAGLRGEDEVFPGQNAARVVRAHFQSAATQQDGKHYLSPVQVAKKIYGESHIVTKELALLEKRDYAVEDSILGSDRIESIGVTFPRTFLPGFIELARPRSTFLSAVPIDVPMVGGRVTLLIQTSGTTFGYVKSDTSPPPKTGLTFASRDMVSRILKGLVIWSRIAMERSTIVTDAMIATEMFRGAANRIDDAGLLGTGQGGEPRGLRELIDSAHVTTARAIAGSQTDADRIRIAQFDLNRAMGFVDAVGTPDMLGVEPERFVVFLSSRDWRWFLTHRTNDGAIAWPSVERDGTLMGWELFHTTKIPTGGDPGGIGSTIIGVDMENVFFGQERDVTLEISTQASVTDDGGTTFNLWERSAGGALLTALHDIDMGRRKMGWILTEVNWGGADPVTP